LSGAVVLLALGCLNPHRRQPASVQTKQHAIGL